MGGGGHNSSTCRRFTTPFSSITSSRFPSGSMYTVRLTVRCWPCAIRVVVDINDAVLPLWLLLLLLNDEDNRSEVLKVIRVPKLLSPLATLVIISALDGTCMERCFPSG